MRVCITGFYFSKFLKNEDPQSSTSITSSHLMETILRVDSLTTNELRSREHHRANETILRCHREIVVGGDTRCRAKVCETNITVVAQKDILRYTTHAYVHA